MNTMSRKDYIKIADQFVQARKNLVEARATESKDKTEGMSYMYDILKYGIQKVLGDDNYNFDWDRFDKYIEDKTYSTV